MDNHQNPKFFQRDQKQQKQRECIFEAGDAVNAERQDLQDCFFVLQNQSMSATNTVGKQTIIDYEDLNKCFPKSNTALLDSRARKRENDKAYRERLKEKETNMKYDLGRIAEENGQLKQENETLKKENAWVNQELQTQSRELDGIKNEFQKLNLENQKQNVLVQTLSDLLVTSPNLGEEYHQLMNENYMLKQNTRADFVRMVEENVKLKHENRVLSAHTDALCAKVVKEGGNNEMIYNQAKN